jgi:hypothetical protein
MHGHMQLARTGERTLAAAVDGEPKSVNAAEPAALPMAVRGVFSETMERPMRPGVSLTRAERKYVQA